MGLTYLDHAATTPMSRVAIEAMMPYLADVYANPSGSHRFARTARRAIDEARDQVADVLGISPGAVVFTGCGTEADNHAIVGAALAPAPDNDPGNDPGSADRVGGALAVCSAAEHHAVIHSIEHVGGAVVGVDATGHIDLNALAAAIGPTTRVVSVMAVNNEVGTITRLDDVAKVVRTHAPHALLHTDAVQAPHWLDLRAVTPLVDLMSISGHKFGGPKGVGVLTIRPGVTIEPLILGGGQERDRRSGTHNVAGIVALAAALREADEHRLADVERIALLRNRLIDTVQARVDGVIETVPRDRKVAGSAHVCIEGVESESLLYLLDEADVCASAASACASGAMEPSHVLTAMGVDPSLSRGALRMTLGANTTAADVDRAIDVLADAVNRLRRITI